MVAWRVVCTVGVGTNKGVGLLKLFPKVIVQHFANKLIHFSLRGKRRLKSISCLCVENRAGVGMWSAYLSMRTEAL